MGFLGNLWDGIKSVGRTIYNGVKSIFGAGESVAIDVGNTQAYDRERAKAAETARINEALSDFKNSAGEQAVALEDRLSDACEEVFEDLMDHIEKLNARDFCGSSLNIPVRKIRSDNRRILRGIRGTLKKEVLPKVSIDNSRCLEILKMDKGENKRRGMLDFINQTLIASINKLKRDLNCDVKNGIEYTKEQIEAGFGNLEGILKSNLNSLKLLKESAGDIETSEREQIGVVFDLWKSQYIYQVSKKKGK